MTGLNHARGWHIYTGIKLRCQEGLVQPLPPETSMEKDQQSHTADIPAAHFGRLSAARLLGTGIRSGEKLC
jgi:hypothetical protein